MEQLNGKELSFNNILDLDAAVKIAKDFQEPAACIIKHNNPCGVAVADELAQAYQDALSCDPLSAFGSIVGLNRGVDAKTAEYLFNAGFVECVIAPEFSQEALQILKKKKNLRLLILKNYFNPAFKAEKAWHYKQVEGGLLLEEKDNNKISEEKLKVVTTKNAGADGIVGLCPDYSKTCPLQRYCPGFRQKNCRYRSRTNEPC